MTKIAIYLFGYDDAQTIVNRQIDGQRWYMALDICNLLGIKNHSQAVHRERVDELTLKDSERRNETIYIGGHGKKKVLLVNNNGMLKLIFQGTSARALTVQERARQTPSHLIPKTWQTEILKNGNS